MGRNFGTAVRWTLFSVLVLLPTNVIAAPNSPLIPADKITIAQLETKRVKVKQKSRKQAAPAAVALSTPHYIEFRSRIGAGYGHAYVVFGDLNSRGAIVSRHYAGLYPTAEAMLVVGHAMPVPAVTTGHPLDHDESRVTASLRVNLSAEEYARAVAVIRQAQQDNTFWHISLNNCNNFVGNVARGLGLRIPHSTLIMPKDYVQELRALNAQATSAAGAGAAATN